MGFWPLWLPGGGSPDPGIASPESAEPATPGIPPDGSNPGTYPGEEITQGSAGDEGWGQQPPPDENNPWAPDNPEEQSQGWPWSNDKRGGEGGREEEGGGGGWFDGDWD
jgi:hypothetical protein